jgi:hypothetical protein
MVKKLLILLISFGMLFVFPICSGDDRKKDDSDSGVYINKNLPTDFRVDTPSSLEVSGSLSSKGDLVSEDPGYDTGGDISTDLCMDNPDDPECLDDMMFGIDGGSSGGYWQVKMTISQLNERARQVEFEMLIIDAFFDKINAYMEENNTNYVPANELSIIFTQEMQNALIASFGEWMPEEMIMDFVPPVGTEIFNPTVTYRLENADEYNHVIQYLDFIEVGMDSDYGVEVEEDVCFDDPMSSDCMMECDDTYCVDFPDDEWCNPELLCSLYPDDPFCTDPYYCETDPCFPACMVQSDSGVASLLSKKAETTNTPDWNTIIRWSNDKKKVSIVDEFEETWTEPAMEPGMELAMEEEYTFNGSTTFTYDGSDEYNEIMTYTDNFKDSFGEFDYSTKLRECDKPNEENKDCVELQILISGESEFECFSWDDISWIEVMRNCESVFSENSFGMADNDGGFIESEIINSWKEYEGEVCVVDDTFSYYFREAFDGTGNLLGLQESFDGGTTWTTISTTGDYSFDDPDDPYIDAIYEDGSTADLDFGWPVVEVTGLTCSEDYCEFVMILPGGSPGNGEDEVGWIQMIFNGTEFEMWVDFWGNPSQTSNVSIYLISGYADATGMAVYQEATGATVNCIENCN